MLKWILTGFGVGLFVFGWVLFGLARYWTKDIRTDGDIPRKAELAAGFSIALLPLSACGIVVVWTVL